MGAFDLGGSSLEVTFVPGLNAFLADEGDSRERLVTLPP